MTGVANNDAAIKFYDEVKKIFKDMSMNVREWASNSSEFLNHLPEEDKMQYSRITKVLGMDWDIENDYLSIPEKDVKNNTSITKRQILKRTASVYDPFGLFTPIILRAKLMLQVLWREGKDWDEELSTDQVQFWKMLESDLMELPKMKVSRFIGNEKCQLLCFCDASAKAYGTCIYLRCVKAGRIATNLIYSKSRVAPEKIITLPRLELLAVLIGVRCLSFV